MIRIILGRAGAGKTTQIMNEIAQLVAAGEPSLLVVPEQYSHSAERHLLLVAGDATSLHCDVLSFRRLMLRVSEELGVGGQTLDDGGMLLTLHRALTAMSGKLELYGGADVRVKFLQSLLATVSELQNNAITADMLYAAAEDTSDALGKKLRDLAMILTSFAAHLPQGYTDCGGEMLRLAEYVAGSEYAKRRLFFDGFSDFTEPEARVVRALIEVGADMTFCLSAESMDEDDDELAVCRETAHDLLQTARECGEKCEIITLGGGERTPQTELFLAPDAIAECETAAVRVSELVREGYRYGEIAVFSRGGDYPQLCEQVFARFGIPTFRAGTEDILTKPPVRLLLTALEICADPRDRDRYIDYLRTGLSGVADDEIDELENRLLAEAVRGETLIMAARAEEYPAFVPIAHLRRSLSRAANCDGLLRAIYAFLEEIELPKSLAARAERLETLGEARLADEYRQLWEIIVNALDDMHAALADAPIEPAELTHLLRLLLSQCTVGVIPTALDRVTLGDMAMSRRRDLRALIVLGATDTNLPKRGEYGGVFSEAERGTMVEELKIPLCDSPERLLYRELYTIHSALALPSERLIFTYADGERVAPAVLKIVGDEAAKSPQKLSVARRRSASEVAAILRARERPTLRGTLSAELAELLYGEEIRLSATRVEQLYACRYAFFLKNGLRLRPRKIGKFAAQDAGDFTHYVLRRATELRDNGESLDELCGRAAREYIVEKIPNYERQTERFRYLLRRLTRGAQSIVADLYEELAASEFEPIGAELGFAQQGDGFVVRGQIDRVDAWSDGDTRYLRVSDYKTGTKDFSLSDAYHGLNLQMLIYLYVLERQGIPTDERFEKTAAAAAVYIPAKDELVNAAYNLTNAEIAKELQKKVRRKGLVLDAEQVINALETSEIKRFLPQSKDYTVSAERFALLVQSVEEKLRGAAEAVRGGEIAAEPYVNARDERKNACQYCEYDAVCAHGTQEDDAPRSLYELSAGEVWRRLEERGTQFER